MIAEMDALLAAAAAALAAAADEAAVEALKVKYLGRKGQVAELMSGLGRLTPAEKPAAGKAANRLKDGIQAALDAALARVGGGARAAAAVDVTLPGRRRPLGRRHPITRVMEDAVAIFRRMGFIVADGPDIETVRNNFDALNAPADHPSRTPEDTFYFGLDERNWGWLDPDCRLLRTQTSPVQVRVMESRQPPIRVVCPGRCYRRDTPDATHGMSFHQIEGLYVARQTSLADLKGTMADFAREMFGPATKIRFRPHFFPFTEPSVECDASCIICGGQGCRVCKNSGWLEIAGAGMVNPAVFRAVGYDPEQVTGYAFGMGLERIAMIRYAINDLRLLYENNVRFLQQF
ncbi:MAG: phenylalanine--tRNA ligase subunit alpha [Lentisphaeria bacterium]